MNTSKMPSLFVGHGSPMNLVEDNTFTEAMKTLGQQFRPKALLVVSAHWEDSHTWVQNSKEQNLIYDFYGFPKELYNLKYPAKGWDEEFTKKLKNLKIDGLQLTEQRGLDHGTWAVLYHMYPQADVPIVQMSIPKGRTFADYFEIGQKMSELRNYGVMIVGSGNIVHNLSQINWQMDAPPVEWAIEFDKLVENYINTKKFEKLLSINADQKELFKLAHPNPDHYKPLAYVLGASTASDEVSYPCSFIQNGSISMRSVLFS